MKKPNIKLWLPVLTGLLFVLTYLLSKTQGIWAAEYELFLFILHLLPSDREFLELSSIRVAPPWAVLLAYGLLLMIYIIKYLRAATTALSFVSVSIILFALLMTEVSLAIFSQIYLPVGLPALVVLLGASIYWLVNLFQRINAGLYAHPKSVSLRDVRKQIVHGEYRKALVMLKQCDYSDELLEVGYDLGMLLESDKHWASALNLYYWLLQFDPGLEDFVTRIEEIRGKQSLRRKLINQEETLHIVGHYELRKKIAQGSSASVYEAYDMRTHNLVALKVMSSKIDSKIERERIDHWLHEAEIVSQFEHRNIAKIHDAANYRDTAYIAMDYILRAQIH